jgi:acyl dehydratase
MTIDYQKLKAWPVPEIEQRYSHRDTMLYALGVGLGRDPTDEAELKFLYEKDLTALPTMAAVLGYPGFWLKEPGTGVDWVKVLHGEQGIRIHQPLPAEGHVVGKTRITEIIDKGPGKGALLYSERDVFDRASGALLCTLTQSAVCRGDGGFGGPTGPVKQPHPVPDRAPDMSCELPTSARAALIYRLSGDYNPLHADPAVARAAGYPKPILHGLCTLGVVGHALLKSICDFDARRLKALDVRFSAPVFPGETVRTEIWREGGHFAFRARVVERDIVVINNGRAEVSG